MKQRDLFPMRPVPRQPQRSVPEAVEPFEFDGSDPRLVPQPNWVPPEELRLVTDDDDWQPGIG